jgi:uncharacterized protein
MLIDFFLTLRKYKVPATLLEFLTLLEALQKRVIHGSIDDFYVLSRAILVKDEIHFDKFDRAFAEYFKGAGALDAIFGEIPEEWLRKLAEKNLTDEEKALIQSLGWRNRRGATRAAASGSARPALRRSAPTDTTPKACGSGRTSRATVAR